MTFLVGNTKGVIFLNFWCESMILYYYYTTKKDCWTLQNTSVLIRIACTPGKKSRQSAPFSHGGNTKGPIKSFLIISTQTLNAFHSQDAHVLVNLEVLCNIFLNTFRKRRKYSRLQCKARSTATGNSGQLIAYILSTFLLTCMNSGVTKRSVLL